MRDIGRNHLMPRGRESRGVDPLGLPFVLGGAADDDLADWHLQSL
jgi:hypothetical protein